MIVSRDEAEPVRRRPWWIGPALVGVMSGAIAGTFISPGELPPCSPQDARVEIVVARFMARLGTSEQAIRDCFTAGRPNEIELTRYAAARPPLDYRIEKISEASDDRGRAWFAAVQVVASWRGDPPEGWSRDRYQWIVLRASGPPMRWTIDETRPPLPRS